MIELKTIRDLNDQTDEGKLLFTAIAILTSLDTKDIKSGKWGGMTHPDTALEQIQDLANRIYFEEEYERHVIKEQRNNKIVEILNDKNKRL